MSKNFSVRIDAQALGPAVARTCYDDASNVDERLSLAFTGQYSACARGSYEEGLQPDISTASIMDAMQTTPYLSRT